MLVTGNSLDKLESPFSLACNTNSLIVQYHHLLMLNYPINNGSKVILMYSIKPFSLNIQMSPTLCIFIGESGYGVNTPNSQCVEPDGRAGRCIFYDRKLPFSISFDSVHSPCINYYFFVAYFNFFCA